jgi:PAS domain S-box-containing protein
MTGVALAIRRFFPLLSRPARLAAPPTSNEPCGEEDSVTGESTEQAQCLKLLRNLGGAVLWESDPSGLRLAFVSATAGEMLGVPADDWLADRGFLRKHVHPEDWGRFLETLYRAGEVNGTQTCDHRMLKADGTVLWVHTSVRPGKTPAGMPTLYGVTMDVSGAQRDDEQSESLWRLLVESVQDYAVFMVSVDGIVENWNPGAQRVKGFRAHEIVGSSISIFFPPEELAKGTLARMFEQASLVGSSTHEGWLIRKGGKRFWGVVTLAAVEDDQGRLRGFSNVARDLSERKRVEEALRDREERLRLLFESVQDYAMFMVSPEGRVESWNPGAERLEGYRSREIIGEPIARFFPPEEIEQGFPGRLLARAAAEERAEYEGWLVRKNGVKFWASIILSAVTDQDGTLRGFSTVARDLTERMRVERAQTFLSEASAVLAGSLDYPVALEKVAQLATRELAHWCVIHMIEAEMLRPVAVAHADRDKAKIAAAALHSIPREPQQPHAVAMVARTGHSELYADTSVAPWAGEALGVEPADALETLGLGSYMCIPLAVRGQTFGVITFVSDAARPYDPHDVGVAEELARRAALAVDNARLDREAQEAVRARDEFISMASHDLRGPLTTIRLQAQSLVRNLRSKAPPGPEDVASKLESVGGQVDRMVHMMELLLDISRITAGQLELQREEVDLAALVSGCAARLVEDAEAAGCELRVEAHRKVVGSWDRMRIEQVVTNLLTNAIKFGPGAPVEVTVEGAGPMATLVVRDYGVGISSEHHAQIFDRFQRVRAQKNVNGFGIGLWIVRRILEAHGGYIRVDSRAGIGATFTVELPMVRAAGS